MSHSLASHSQSTISFSNDALANAVLETAFDVVVVVNRDSAVEWGAAPLHDSGASESATHGDVMLFGSIHPADLPHVVERFGELSSAGSRVDLGFRIRDLNDPEAWRHLTGIAFVADELLGPDNVVVCANFRTEAGAAFDVRDASDGELGFGLLSENDELIWVNQALGTLTGIAEASIERLSRDNALVVGEIARLAAMARAGHNPVSNIELLGRKIRMRIHQLDRDATDDVMLSVEDVTTEISSVPPYESGRRIAAAFDFSQSGIALIGLDGRILETNEAWSTITGYAKTDLVGCHLADFTDPRDLGVDLAHVQELISGLRDTYRVEKRHLQLDGTTIWVDLRVAIVRDGRRPAHFVANITDITETKRNEEQLRAQNEVLTHQATHDHLTGLPNRLLLDEQLRLSAARLGRSDKPTFVMFCDLDRFKQVNDQHGHDVGDQALVEVARRLREVCREGDVVARVGGDEFVVVLESLADENKIHGLAQRYVEALDRPMSIGSIALDVGVSIGITRLLRGDQTGFALRRADLASYEAKKQGGGFAFDER